MSFRLPTPGPRYDERNEVETRRSLMDVISGLLARFTDAFAVDGDLSVTGDVTVLGTLRAASPFSAEAQNPSANEGGELILAGGGTAAQWHFDSYAGGAVRMFTGGLVYFELTASSMHFPRGKIMVTRSAASDVAYESYVSGDGQSRFRATAAGGLSWGPGGATTTDVSLARSAAGVLGLSGSLDITTGLNVQAGGVDAVGNSSVNGQLTVGNGALVIDTPAGGEAQLAYFASGEVRWNIRRDGTAESGANAGSDLVVERYSDSEAFLGAPLRIARATGNATFANDVNAVGTLSQAGNAVWHDGRQRVVVRETDATSSGGYQIALPLTPVTLSTGRWALRAVLMLTNDGGAANVRLLLDANTAAASGFYTVNGVSSGTTVRSETAALGAATAGAFLTDAGTLGVPRLLVVDAIIEVASAGSLLLEFDATGANTATILAGSNAVLTKLS